MTGKPVPAGVPHPSAGATATGWAVLPLRLFLGVTFVFAGVQKLADPRFFRASYPGSIQAQLHVAASASPLRPLLDGAGHAPVVVGVLLALGEVVVGAGALLGLGARLAAVGGMAISAVLFLTVSFHDSPYYLGSDIVFLFAWTPLALVGTGGVWSLDAHWSWLTGWLPRGLGRRRSPDGIPSPAPTPAAPAPRPVAGPVAEPGDAPALTPAADLTPAPAAPAPATIGRRTFLGRGRIVALAGAAGLLAAGLAEWVGTRPGQTPTAKRGRSIGRTDALSPGAAVAFTDPATGDPAYLVQPGTGQLVAFDATCPHARCPVGYLVDSGQFVCPCHGSRFDARTGAVLTGPATVGLTRIGVSESSDGRIYAGDPPPSP